MSYYPTPGQVVVSPAHQSSTAHVVIAWIFAIGTGGYLLPWAIAATRNKENTLAIALIDLLVGWSVVGWIAALVMACTANPVRQTVLVSPYASGPQVSPGAYPSYPTYGPPQPPYYPPSGPEPTLRLPRSYDHRDQPR